MEFTEGHELMEFSDFLVAYEISELYGFYAGFDSLYGCLSLP
jgi:hypothetical protein